MKHPSIPARCAITPERSPRGPWTSAVSPPCYQDALRLSTRVIWPTTPMTRETSCRLAFRLPVPPLRSSAQTRHPTAAKWAPSFITPTLAYYDATSSLAPPLPQPAALGARWYSPPLPISLAFPQISPRRGARRSPISPFLRAMCRPPWWARLLPQAGVSPSRPVVGPRLNGLATGGGRGVRAPRDFSA